MILVDTSVFVDFFKGVQNDHSKCFENVIKQQIPFGLTPVVYQELLQGAKNKKEYDFLDEYLKCQRFFHPQDPVMTFGHAAIIYFSCRKQGITVRSTIDCLIAQVAIEHDLILLHNDKDFIQMASVIDLKLYEV